MLFAVILLLLIIGTVVFHFWSPWWFTPIASNWQQMDDTVNLTFFVTGIVFIAVNLFLAYSVYKFRHKKGQKADYEPENKKLEWWLTIVTSIGVAAMLAPGLFVWANFVTVPEEATEVEAVGQQWHWSFRFPGKDGLLGETDARLITPDNLFGMSPDDPNGQDDVLIASPELHLPIDQPVKLLLRSKDVLHNFTVPQFRVKMDLVPGMVTYQWLTPTKVGQYEILCEEFCGIAHHAMRGKVFVDTEQDFQTWLDAQPTWGELKAAPAGDVVAGQGLYALCTACHGQQGEGNQMLNAPKLAGQEPLYLKRQLVNYKLGLRGTSEGDIYGAQMVPFAATLPDDAAIENVVAYIGSLPDDPLEPTISGDAERGKDLYTTCAGCHGEAGEGIWALNAPRLQNMSDWDLARQIDNFRTGLRGAHPKDYYGDQMARMATIVRDERASNDLIAYINSL